MVRFPFGAELEVLVVGGGGGGGVASAGLNAGAMGSGKLSPWGVCPNPEAGIWCEFCGLDPYQSTSTSILN